MTSTDSPNGRRSLTRRNTFQKMLELERKHKVDRMQASPSIPPMPRSRKTSVPKDQYSHLEAHPALLGNKSRVMTAPAPSVAIPHADPTADSSAKKYVIKAGNVIPQGEVENGNESERSSICHSPGWDDPMGNKKKKEKQAAKDKKNAENKKLETEAKQAAKDKKIAENKRLETEAKQAAKDKKIAENKRLETEAKQAAKDKKIVENKRLETEANHAARMKNRLSKPPPTNRRFSHMAMTISASASSPAIQTMAGTSQTTSAKEQSPKEGTRSRRGSFDAGLKNLLSATQTIPSLFSRNSYSRTSSLKTRETPSPTSSGSGFIGGLKLRLSEDAQAQGKMHQSGSTTKDERTTISEHRTPKEGSGNPTAHASKGADLPSNSTDKGQEIKNVHSHKPKSGSTNDESGRAPQQRDSIHAHAGQTVTDEVKPKSSPSVAVYDDNWPPIMQRSMRPSGQAGQSMFPVLPTETKKHAARSVHSRPRTSEEVSNYSRREESPRSSERKTGNREPSVDSRIGRTSGTYVQNQRLLSKDRAMTAFHDEYRNSRSTDSPVRQRSPSFHSVKSHASTDMPPNQPSIGANSSLNPPEEVTNNFSFLSGFATPPVLQLDNISLSSDTAQRNHHRDGSRGLKALKIEAKPEFPKTPVPSPTANSFVSTIFDMADSRPTSNRGPTSLATERSSLNGPPSKAGGILGEVFTQGLARGSPMPSPSNSVPLIWRRSGVDSPDVGPRKSTPMQHTRNATDSSEEYSTLDEFSNVTTPMASRPHSQKEYFPPMGELNKPKFPKESTISSKAIRAKRVPIMSGAIPYGSDLYGGNDSWSRTTMPLDLTHDEHGRTPTGYQSPTGSSATIATHPMNQSDGANPSTTVEPAKESKSASALQRQLSLSRSASTPELQDLSFLPALKHQPLIKPPVKKDKGNTAVRRETQPASSRDPESNEVIKPPPISVLTPRSESPSSASPSGYLRDARMSLPSQRRHSQSPKELLFPGSNSSSKQVTSFGSTPDPMAKIFVVCCSCKYFHDMPSRIYECMAKPDDVVEDKDLGISGVVSTSVKCPWCGHGMNTACCAGYAAVVYLREKLH